MIEKPFFKTKIAFDVKEEWIYKEEGSWEDHDCPDSGHIYPLLTNMPYDQIICKSKEDAAIILRSAEHQRHWDDDDPVVKRLKRKCSDIYEKLKSVI